MSESQSEANFHFYQPKFIHKWGQFCELHEVQYPYREDYRHQHQPQHHDMGEWRAEDDQRLLSGMDRQEEHFDLTTFMEIDGRWTFQEVQLRIDFLKTQIPKPKTWDGKEMK
jgi:hypothetical protein